MRLPEPENDADMMSTLRLLDRAIVWCGECCGTISAGLFGLLALTIVFDVLSRTLLTLPTTWALESVTYMMVSAVFIGAPYVMLKNEHIGIELLTGAVSAGIRAWLRRAILVTVAVMFMVIAWEAFQLALRARTLGLSSPTVYIPIWPIQMTIPIGAVLTVLEATRQLFTSFHREPRLP